MYAKMDKLGGYYARSNKPVTEIQVLHDSMIYEASKLVKLIETGSKIVVAGERKKWGITVQHE